MTGQIRCDFCGFEFDPTCDEAGMGASACESCPVSCGCNKITCPRCGYQILPEAKLIGWFRQLKQKMQAVRISSGKEVNK